MIRLAPAGFGVLWTANAWVVLERINSTVSTRQLGSRDIRDCLEANARAIAEAAAGSSSGGESNHLSSGFKCCFPLSTIGVPGLLGISIGLDDDSLWADLPGCCCIMPRRRALASQLAICVLLSPVWFWSISFSSSLGYGSSSCAKSHCRRIETASLEKRVPTLGGGLALRASLEPGRSSGVELLVGFVCAVVAKAELFPEI